MDKIEALLLRYKSLACCEDSIRAAGDIMLSAFRGGDKILVCGNGGSAADAEHICGELLKKLIMSQSLALRSF